MLNKLFGYILIVVVLFVLSVFKAPELAKSISDLIGMPQLPNTIKEFKTHFDGVVTNIPTQQELEDQYNTTVSGAIELKKNIIDGVQVTKDKVDSFRETMSGAQQQVNDLKDTYNDAKDFIDETSQKIDQAKQIIEDTQAVIDNVQNVGEGINN